MRKTLFNLTLLVIVIVPLIIASNTYAMSFSQASKVYDQIASSNGFRIYPRLILSPSKQVNASATALRITVNQGMLNFVRNSNEMAMVLGHELSHYSLGHARSTPSNEYAADSLGARYAAKAGYNRCDGALVYLRFHSKGSATHPPSDLRYKRLKC